MITIAKSFTFDAAHRLERLPETHKCHRMHGHTYTVELQLSGEPNSNGFVVDYADMAEAWQPIHDLVDHRVLNEVRGLEIPSTEVIVEWIFHKLVDHPVIGPLLAAVVVKESSTTWAKITDRQQARKVRHQTTSIRTLQEPA